MGGSVFSTMSNNVLYSLLLLRLFYTAKAKQYLKVKGWNYTYIYENWGRKSHTGAVSPSSYNNKYKLFAPLKQQELILSRPQRKTL